MADVAKIQIRRAQLFDEPDIRSCVEAAYSLYVERIGKPPAPMLDDYAALIVNGAIRVATTGNNLVGLVVGWSKDDHFYVDNIAVDPKAQGFGVGSLLLADAEAQARDGGHSEIQLYTNTTVVENIDFYPRHGFVETHRATEEGYERVYFSRHLSHP